MLEDVLFTIRKLVERLYDLELSQDEMKLIIGPLIELRESLLKMNQLIDELLKVDILQEIILNLSNLNYAISTTENLKESLDKLKKLTNQFSEFV